MNYWQAIVLAMVEGITEFLPVSSTGHLILASRVLGITQTEFVKSFEIAIQLGAIGAVVFLYAQTLIRNFAVWKKIIIAFLPTGIVGLVFYSFIKHFLLGNFMVVVFSLFWGGILMLFLEKYFTGRKREAKMDRLRPSKALLIGFGQSLSIVPGVSRAAATIFSGLGVGLSRQEAVEFSFLLAIPTMAAAAGLDLLKTSGVFHQIGRAHV